jgi:glycine cleavage system H protein
VCRILKIKEYEVPEELLYTRNHEWIKIDKDRGRIGITDYAQKSLHDIVFVDLPKIGIRVKQGQTLGTVESVKAVADVFAPVSCEILEVNTKLADTPELINQQPYGEGWIAVVSAVDLDVEKKDLMNTPSYGEFLRSQIQK